MNRPTSHRPLAEQISFTALINSFCREFTNWSRYEGIPQYDEALAAYMRAAGHVLYLKIDFAALGVEVFVPLQYFSETGTHAFYFPVVERDLGTDGFREITAARFTELVAHYAAANHFPKAAASLMQQRLQNSTHNLDTLLAYVERTQPAIHQPHLSFIEAEQSLIAGHSTHPLARTREGFTDDDLINYSPETGARFRLHYFLVHPDHVHEKSATETLPSRHLHQELMGSMLSPGIKKRLAENPRWKIVPAHPWEARYLLEQPAVKDMQSKGLLYSLGELGAFFTATSSVRTVYNEDSDWMYKFSLHVKITNSCRVNYPHELYRGYDAACLLQSSWGEALQQQYPEVTFITDPAYMMVSYEGKIIDGFTTSIRTNVFKGEKANRNVTLLAALCQDGILGQPARLERIINEIADRCNRPLEEVAIDWFQRYLYICVRPLIGIFNQFGLGSEYHQQNILLELDDQLFPARIYFRDNQGFFFREGKVAELLRIMPGFGKDSRSFIPETRMYRYWDHYLITNHLFGIISALGKSNLVGELTLLRLLYTSLKAWEPSDTTGLIPHFLESSKLNVKGNLLTSLLNMDEASAPREFPAVYCAYPNPLHKYFFSATLINPASKKVFYSRYFPKEDVVISLRAVDLEKDLVMLHEWFNREHAKKIWQMDWPIRKLEAYYRTAFAGDVMHAYIGEANGEPSFYFEVYWAIRDLVGAYYEVLPTDYGTHQFIASTDPKKKYASPSTQCMVDYVFAQPEVGKMVGEGSVDSMASLMNKIHVGFKVEKVIEMPHKKAHLNFCYREWYWAKFPLNKNIKITPLAERAPEKSF